MSRVVVPSNSLSGSGSPPSTGLNLRWRPLIQPQKFHDLRPRLAGQFHVIAPDYPGMGYSTGPEPTALQPTFDHAAKAIDAFIAQRAMWLRRARVTAILAPISREEPS